MFNILIDSLPYTVEVDGLEYAIRYQADVMIRIAILIENNPSANTDDYGQAELAWQQLQIFYPEIPRNAFLAMQRLIEFYSHTPEIAVTREPRKFDLQKPKNFSFKHDANIIYAAFLQQYGIRGFSDIHWYEFKALMEGLTEECLFVKAMQFRSMKIPSKMPKDQKDYYRKMKRLYRLPDDRPQDVRDKDFASALMYL